VVHHRLVHDRRHWLGGVARKRAQSRPEPASHDYSFHRSVVPVVKEKRNDRFDMLTAKKITKGAVEYNSPFNSFGRYGNFQNVTLSFS
jgi:hypothetical protein